MRFWIKRVGLFCLAVSVILSFSGCTLMTKLKARDRLIKGARFYEEKKFNEAAGQFQESIQLDPELTNAYLYLAMAQAAMASGNPEKTNQAIKTYEEVVA